MLTDCVLFTLIIQLIAIKKIAPAIAAGNSVVVKPSELAPITVLDFAKLCHEAGLPAGVLNVVPGYGGLAGRALAESPLIKKLDLTGGTPTGKTCLPSSSCCSSCYCCCCCCVQLGDSDITALSRLRLPQDAWWLRRQARTWLASLQSLAARRPWWYVVCQQRQLIMLTTFSLLPLVYGAGLPRRQH